MATHHTYIPMYHHNGRGGRITPLICPFGVRDLEHDECYSGNGQNRCKWFVRYEWCNEHNGCIHCTHPPVDLQQLELFPL